jgi:phospholipase/carboxylesterase
MPQSQGFHFITGRRESSLRPLLLLHGSGGLETNLVSLADDVAPDRPYLSLRGGIAWEGGFAFFRRNPDRSLDYADLAEQTELLCRFLESLVQSGELKTMPVLLGFSNGAIMAASILRQRPALAAGAILVRPLSPAPDDIFALMPGLPILITAGRDDHRRDPKDAALMHQQFEHCQADVSTHLLPTGHGLHDSEAGLIRDWLIQKGL